MKIIFEMPYGYVQLDDLDSVVYPIPRIDEYVTADDTAAIQAGGVQLMVAAVVYDYVDKSVYICLTEI